MRRRRAAETGFSPANPRGGDTSVVLVYPNTYHVGMSNLGFLTVYRLLNELDGVVCERAFLPDAARGETGVPHSVESGRPIAVFDVVAFSIAFENDFLNLLRILEKAHLPLHSNRRSDRHPLVMAGGVACFINPETIAPFIDVFLLGEAEAILPLFFDRIRENVDRFTALADAARELDGIYVPRFYQDLYHADGSFKALEPMVDAPLPVKRAYVKSMDATAACSSVLTDDTTFGRTFLLELSRGCPHGCRFCSAGFVYRPLRFPPAEALQDGLDRGLALTNRIGILGMAVTASPAMDPVCRRALDRGGALSFSSLRADELTPSCIALLRRSGVKTVTIAPDAGSERMRRIINKGLTRETILAAVERTAAAGIPNLKLYFMLGLPFETPPDVEAVVALCRQIKHRLLKIGRRRRRLGTITVSLNAFVPKPHTPFQWAPMEEVRELKHKIKFVKKALARVPNIRVHADIPHWAAVQGLLTRGDRRVSGLLEKAHTLDGNWPRTFKESALNPHFYLHRTRPLTEALPWDFIDHGIRKSFLKSEYRKARRAEETPACRFDGCTVCGVCKPAVP